MDKMTDKEALAVLDEAVSHGGGFAPDPKPAEGELLPLPEPVDAMFRAAWGPKPDTFTDDQMTAYARANVAHLHEQLAVTLQAWSDEKARAERAEAQVAGLREALQDLRGFAACVADGVDSGAVEEYIEQADAARHAAEGNDMSNGNEPAYPQQAHYDGQKTHGPKPGLTKREAFAMAAMQGILANPYYAEQANSPDCYGDLSDAAIYHADALLAALAKEPK